MILALLFFFTTGQSYRYWVEPCVPAESACQPGDAELADWALQAWQQVSSGRLHLTKVRDRDKAHIRLYWAGARQGLFGEARPIEVDGRRGAEVFVRPVSGVDDPLLRDTIVYLTCLHETGHALGLAHTANFDDIMYSFQYGGDIPEYFGRYRRKLKAREDIHKNPGISDADKKRLLEIVAVDQP